MRLIYKDNLDTNKAAFGQTLLALKICNARNVYYRFLALIAFARM